MESGFTSNMKNTITLFTILLLAPLYAMNAAETPKPKPNIILILADDLGYGGLGCYGQTHYQTPHLDRMASEGARLTQFNCPAPFCAPTRASLLTGRYPFRCGMTANPAPDGGEIAHQLHLPASEVLLPELLKEAGYCTGMFGKWHLGHAEPGWLPTHRGFEEYFGIPYSNDMRPVALFEGDQQVEYPVIQANLTKRYTARALAFLEEHQSQPFFLFLAHAMPHKPLAVSEEFYHKSGGGLYGDAVSELDWSIGQVLARLKELKLDENTLVMFTSDNGATFGGSCGGLRGMKGSSYEGGYRVPMIARWPGRIPAGQTLHGLAVMMDLFSTTLAAANLAPPGNLIFDGRNLLPMLTEGAKSPHQTIFGHLGPRLATVRDERWKLHVLKPGEGLAGVGKDLKPGERYNDPRGPDGVTIFAPFEQSQPSEHPGLRTGEAGKPMQLFDLETDPGEQRDVAALHSDVVQRLRNTFDLMTSQLHEQPSPPSADPKRQPGK
jgi:N-acetylgalactosamine-6-sulfatase